MKIKSFTWTVGPDGQFELKCPACNTAWVKDDNGDYSRDACEHLRFVWTEGGLEYFGDWDTEAFEKAYIKACMKIEELDDPEDVSLAGPDYDVLESLNFTDIDEVLEITETGLACGPVSITVFFGFKS